MLSSKKMLLAALAMAALACGDSSGPGAANPNPGPLDGDAGATGSSDAGATGSDADGSVGGDPADAGFGGGSDSGNPNVTGPDGGPFVPDPNSLDDGGALQGSGSCCAEHDTPGCSNADLMVCVCELDPTCCSEAWGKQCAFIVEHKYCQPGVRECVCGQTQCCEGDEWSNFCDRVAEIKCGAVPGCF